MAKQSAKKVNQRSILTRSVVIKNVQVKEESTTPKSNIAPPPPATISKSTSRSAS